MRKIRKLTIVIILFLLTLPYFSTAQNKLSKIEVIKDLPTLIEKDRKMNKVLNLVPDPIIKILHIPGSVVGYNFYDRITGGGIGERILNLGDGTLMIGTMAAVDSTLSLATRGTYYNYFNGTSWLDTSFIWKRIEAVKRGDGTIGVFKTTKSAVICSHTGLNVAVNIGPPDNPNWINKIVPPSTTWPKLAVDDAGGLYYGIYIVAGVVEDPLRFIYSLDGASTFHQKYLIDTSSIEWRYGYLSGIGRDLMIAAKNGKIAVVNFPAGGNVTLFLSTDNGTNFTTRTLFNAMAQDSMLSSIPFDSSFFPAMRYKMLDLWYADGTGDVHIDNSGNVHAAWGTIQLGYRILVDNLGHAIRDSTGKLQRIFFVTDWALTGIKYWKTGMSAPITAVVPNASMSDSSLMTFTQTGVPTTINESLDAGLIGIPSLGTDTSGNVFMVFQGYKGGDVMANDSNEPEHKNPFGHVYVVASSNGTTWTAPKDIYGTSIMGEDVLFPSLADLVDDKLHILVQNDRNPGTWLLQISHPQNKNYFVYTTLLRSNVLTDVRDAEVVPKKIKLYQNYPNPFNPVTNIKFETPNSNHVTLKIYDILGREVATLVDEIKEAGVYNSTFSIRQLTEHSTLSTGVYFYELKAGDFRAVKKMLLIK